MWLNHRQDWGRDVTTAHPNAVAAMRARIEALRDSNGDLDPDVLAQHLADHLAVEAKKASERRATIVKDQQKEIRRLRALTGTALPDPDREATIRAISGCINACINDHGPVTADLSFSAAKRVYGHLVSRRLLRGATGDA